MGVGGGNGRLLIGKEKKMGTRKREGGEGRIYHGREQREREEENEKG
jgi:hypothetical protein